MYTKVKWNQDFFGESLTLRIINFVNYNMKHVERSDIIVQLLKVKLTVQYDRYVFELIFC